MGKKVISQSDPKIHFINSDNNGNYSRDLGLMAIWPYCEQKDEFDAGNGITENESQQATRSWLPLSWRIDFPRSSKTNKSQRLLRCVRTLASEAELGKGIQLHTRLDSTGILEVNRKRNHDWWFYYFVAEEKSYKCLSAEVPPRATVRFTLHGTHPSDRGGFWTATSS